MRTLIAVLSLLPTLAVAGTSIELSPQASADLAVVQSFSGQADADAWLEHEIDRMLAERVAAIRNDIMQRMKAQYIDPLRPMQMVEYWKTRILPTPYPTVTARPTATATIAPSPTSTAIPTATHTAVPTAKHTEKPR